jgi:hypothetical protein
VVVSRTAAPAALEMLSEPRIDARRDVDVRDSLDAHRLAQAVQARGAQRVAAALPSAAFADAERG